MNVLEPRTTTTATTIIAAMAPPDKEKAPFCEPAAPASLGSCGLSLPPLYPGGGRLLPEDESCARASRGKRSERRRGPFMMVQTGMLECGTTEN